MLIFKIPQFLHHFMVGFGLRLFLGLKPGVLTGADLFLGLHSSGNVGRTMFTCGWWPSLHCLFCNSSFCQSHWCAICRLQAKRKPDWQEAAIQWQPYHSTSVESECEVTRRIVTNPTVSLEAISFGWLLWLSLTLKHTLASSLTSYHTMSIL